MGLSFLSIKLAAVFGLVIAAAVTVQQREAVRGATVEAVAEEAAVLAADAAEKKCDAAVRSLVRTAPARATAQRAAGAGRS
jgi:hypothetical protein